MLFWLKEEMAPQELTRRLATVTTHVDEIMQQEIRPLLAVDIIEQLHRQFAVLSGGRGKDGAPIITFPEFVGFKHISDEDFLNVVTYLTSIPSVEAAGIGFIVVIDRRRDRWSSVKASLTRIAAAFPGNLQLIFILRPSRFIQRTITDIGIKYYRDEFKMKVPIVMLNSVSDLQGYIDKSQLTEDLGGTLEYRHSQWINHRTAIENFALTLKTTAQMLQMFGTHLATTRLPRSVPSTEELLMSHTKQRDKLQDELKLLGKQGATLLSCIQEPATKNPTYKLNLNHLENVATMERLLVQLDETEKAFNQFWSQHHLKLNQCIQLQHFECNFCEVKLALDNLLAEQAEFTDVGDSVMHVEQLLKEHKKLEGKGQEPLEKAQLLAIIGDQLIQSHHYAADSIRPKCVELRHLCDHFINENKKKYDILGKSLELHRQLDKVSQWCEAGIYLLASQAVDKCQSREGVDAALNDIEAFLETTKECQLPRPKEFYNQLELVLTPDRKARAQKVLQKLGDVQEIFHKRQMGLMKLAARQTRPVQPVAPHPESSPKWMSLKTSHTSPLAPLQKTSEEPYVEADLNPLEKVDDKTKYEGKNEEILESSHDGENPEWEQVDSPENLSPSRSIIRDLLETEEVYIKEMKSIIDGYITPMDFIWLKHLIPDVLQNNKDFLFGNIRELYEFHNRTFLKELEKCTENPELLARCFLKRREDLQMYFEYHKNLPRARAIWGECQDCAYLGVCQRQLGHNLPLFKYLRGPSQRLIKYQMLLKDLLDFESPEDLKIDPGDLEGCSAKNEPTRTKDPAFLAELRQAVAMMGELIKSCELAVDLAAVTGCPEDIGALGRLLLRGLFSVWTVRRERHKVKDFMRFKPSQRQIYLFEKGIVFCKIRMEPSDQGLSPHYSFKKSMKLTTLSIHQLERGSNRKFEIANRNGLEKYILQAASKEDRDSWFSEISKLLMEQQNNNKDVYEDEGNDRQISPKCCSGGACVSTETWDGAEGAEAAEERSALGLSGLFQPDGSCEPGSAESAPAAGGKARGAQAERREESEGGSSPGISLQPARKPSCASEAVRGSVRSSCAPAMPWQLSPAMLLFMSLAVILHYGSQVRAAGFPESTDSSHPTRAATVQAVAKPSFLQPTNQVPHRTTAGRSTGGRITSQTAATASSSETPATHTTVKTPTTSLITTNSTPSTSPIIHTLVVTTLATPNNSHTAAPVTEATAGPSAAPSSLPPTSTPPVRTTGTNSSTVSHTTGKTTQASNQTTLPATLSTSTHINTTSQKPTQPTHALGTTTAAHNATQTASPVTTTPGPTLAPLPSPAKTGTYQVLNGSRLCIKAEMGIELTVQDIRSVFLPLRYFNIDPNATQASGNCGSRNSNLLLNFQGGFVNLTFTKDENSYYVSEVGAYLTVSNPETIYQGMKSSVMLFETVIGHSFKCVSEQSIQLSAHLQLKTMNVQLQAFDFEDDHFGNVDECSSDYTVVLPVIGAIVLGLCAVGLIVYGVRLRRESSGYQRI